MNDKINEVIAALSPDYLPHGQPVKAGETYCFTMNGKRITVVMPKDGIFEALVVTGDGTIHQIIIR